MQKNVWMAIIALTAVAGGYFLWRGAQKPGELDQFALCLGDKGAVFYGAFWCPHCQNQKKMFKMLKKKRRKLGKGGLGSAPSSGAPAVFRGNFKPF